METINIKFRGYNLEKRLSNLHPYKFEMDGIEFLKGGNIDLEKYQWQP